jgi:hypothetical protein
LGAAGGGCHQKQCSYDKPRQPFIASSALQFTPIFRPAPFYFRVRNF